ncbi:hypothetical protein GCM10010294_07200 [Streptomyces griseoloalbus]|nr:hypothetical protein GCM10010294_07200 [Streptomyces griseoloalbus]
MAWTRLVIRVVEHRRLRRDSASEVTPCDRVGSSRADFSPGGQAAVNSASTARPHPPPDRGRHPPHLPNLRTPGGLLLMMYRQQTKYHLGPTCTAPKHSAFASADGG